MKKLNFNTYKDQQYSGMGGLRTVKYEGKCLICGNNTYRMYNDAGKDDTDCRGPLGMFHTNNNLIPSDYGYSGDEVILCWNCSSEDSQAYHKALKHLQETCIKIEN